MTERGEFMRRGGLACSVAAIRRGAWVQTRHNLERARRSRVTLRTVPLRRLGSGSRASQQVAERFETESVPLRPFFTEGRWLLVQQRRRQHSSPAHDNMTIAMTGSRLAAHARTFGDIGGILGLRAAILHVWTEFYGACRGRFSLDSRRVDATRRRARSG